MVSQQDFICISDVTLPPDMDPWQAAQIFVAITMADYISGSSHQQSSMTQILSTIAKGPGFVSQ
jgi:hypothetical protein